VTQSLVTSLFFVLLTALAGGLFVRFLKLPPLLGYILAGSVGSFFLNIHGVEGLADLGVILLLFSVGLELSLDKIFRFGKISILGAILQIIIVTFFCYGLLGVMGLSSLPSLVLGFGFSLSSTAVVVKLLEDRSETETIHGGIMTGWLLVQDLAVIPMVVVLPVLASGGQNIFLDAIIALIKALAIVAVVYFFGRRIAPFILRKVAESNSRELLILASVSLALGIAQGVSLFGISAPFGAFLAGLVIAETQENHAIFSETRPLRDLFVILFFVSLGFLVSPTVLVAHFWLILGLSMFIIVIKTIVTYVITLAFGYRGKPAFACAIGLSQVGEFSFLLLVSARALNILTPSVTAIAMATTLATLLITPLIFKAIDPAWKRVRQATAQWPSLLVESTVKPEPQNSLQNHIIVCGYGRVGRWVCKALNDFEVPCVIVDYNHSAVREAKKAGLRAIFGNSGDQEILKIAGIAQAKAIVIAFPDKTAQEDVIDFARRHYPHVDLVVRAHKDEDIKKLFSKNVAKVIQPEFEGALAVVRHLLSDMGVPQKQISQKLKNLRISHTNHAAKIS
jgi:CPA2 family monovalent cation:H+ antiporter-2